MKYILDNSSKANCSIFKYNFSNLTDLYNYLKSNPRVNSEIFKEQSSIEGEAFFAGEPLENAIEYLRGGYKDNFDKFAIAVKSVSKFGYEDTDSRKLTRGLYGGTYLPALVAAGVPDCMIRYERDSSPKHLTIYFQLNYPWTTTEKQIFNRGIATINLIQALEKKGYIVDLKVFELAECDNEYIDITVFLKHVDENLNISKCYYPFVSKEFFRRLLFRVFESTPVKNNWGEGYGTSVDDDIVREFYKLRERDLLISEPRQMNIVGNNIYEDTLSLFKKLKLEDEFDLSALQEKRYDQEPKKYVKK